MHLVITMILILKYERFIITIPQFLVGTVTNNTIRTIMSPLLAITAHHCRRRTSLIAALLAALVAASVAVAAAVSSLMNYRIL